MVNLARLGRSKARIAQLSLVLLAAILPLVLSAAQPFVSKTHFSSLPARISYFPDSSTVLYHDAVHGTVYRSENEGRDWKVIEGPGAPTRGQAAMLVEHPTDPKRAFILTAGKTHHRTIDRGNTWQSFEVPLPPATRAGAPLEFHQDSSSGVEKIIYAGKKCSGWTPWGTATCHDVAYYTLDGFASPAKPLIEFLLHCIWAKATPTLSLPAERQDRIYCIAWEDSPTGGDIHVRSTSSLLDDPRHLLRSRGDHRLSSRAVSGATRLYYSDDFFKSRTLVQMDMGRDARNFIGIGPSGSYLVAALRDISSSTGGNAGDQMALFVSRDGESWHKGKFPHDAGLQEGAYTIVEGTTHSLVVDVFDPGFGTGRLFTSDSEGIHFVQSLDGTNRNARGIVDYEHLENIEGAALANIRAGLPGEHRVRTRITWDDGSRWAPLSAPDDKCKGQNPDTCSLHLYSASRLHNIGRVFSSTVPGFVMGVGSVGDRLLPYEDCQTYLSTDAGHTWRKIADDAHKYELGDGGLLVQVNDEEPVDFVLYSWNHGKTWDRLKLPVRMRAKILTTIPDNTAQKFLLIGSLSRLDAGTNSRHVALFLDFAAQKKRKCDKNRDMEQWYVGGLNAGCLMGRKQWYLRRKADADCIIGDKFHDPEPHMKSCACTDEDFECDFGFVRAPNGQCVSDGSPEHIPEGDCVGSKQTYKASSGYRKIAGNTCEGGVAKDQKVTKQCSARRPENGQVLSSRHEFPGTVVDRAWFADSSYVIMQVSDGSIWISPNDGYSWMRPELVKDPHDPEQRFLTLAMHLYEKTYAYLITSGQRCHYTFDGGKTWHYFTAPLPPNGLGIPILRFHPDRPDWLIWIGSRDCNSVTSQTCHTAAYYTLNQGRDWTLLDRYVRNCAWARSPKFHVDSSSILCESYVQKTGNQHGFGNDNHLQLILGSQFYTRKNVLFENIIGFANFEEYLVLAKIDDARSMSISLQVSLDANTFAKTQFPPNTRIDDPRAYTVLDSVTDAIFLHVTTHPEPKSAWGNLFKSNSNGTYFALSLEYVNRNAAGFADFEKVFGLDGIALVNVVNNPEDAAVNGVKALSTRITHNDGGRWKPLTPPRADVNGAPYDCHQVGCSLHLHGYTERDDPTTMFSSPTAVGLLLGVGNVGKSLAPYADSDTFISRDGGFSWEEVHKDAHKWEFGDQGSIILLANDERPTNEVLYSLDEGKSWQSYKFGETLRVTGILTVPEDTHRKFVLLGIKQGVQPQSVAVHLDFSALQRRKCKLDASKPEADDFELWSPSEERAEPCLFGRQTFYYRRRARADCFVGETLVQPHSIGKNCSCTAADFECEFNHYLDPEGSGRCLQYPGTTLPPPHVEEQCLAYGNEDYYFDRTSVRKIPYSSCIGGDRPDRGRRHSCPASLRGHGFFWWSTVILSPFALAGLVGSWWLKRHRSRGYGAIHLPDARDYVDGKLVDTIASVPAFVIGVSQAVAMKALDLAEEVPFLRRWIFERGRHTGPRGRGSYGNYSHLGTDEDAAILENYEEEDAS
ncbi:Oligoxyloglucan reducing end-specific cellobiohydrolase [Ceraceosorus guamensis]|uniref:Oligoxyloglucan reducing end-specific cellobiohydrolase n=1 Tax=Ceraceosorus guamensis TaxID=1522189 RepID=A0A316VZ16_9BASI|nr:Oligoxyloglucan reducing end-specific cellobiohydrolase [Ceraceosorus guamensis]PWN42574.1 Oligoxyloglucan reducing end-specific cellobiohydrolase [Ceraceosorus guamensis]